LQLPEIQQGMKLFVAGSRVTSHLWGTDGKIYHGVESEQPKNFNMHAYDSKQISKGFLEIRYGPGLVKIWQALISDDGQSFMGNKDMAETAVFTEGMGTLTREPNRPQLREFSIDSPTFVSLETPTPTAMALMSEEKVLYMSTVAFRTGHQLNHYLPAGTYRLMTRVLPGTDSPGNLILKTITPTPLAEEEESPMQIIRPGELQVFRFSVKDESKVGVGLRTENDTLEARLFDEKSQLMATGPLMLKKLPPGTYLLVVETRDVPVQYRPIILGTKGSREGVPDDVIQKYKKETDQ
jgi:hypothetical protein